MLGDTLKGPINLGFIQHRTVFHAAAAPGTTVHIDTARSLSDSYRHISFLAGNIFHI
jgi:hypothetical protein